MERDEDEEVCGPMGMEEKLLGKTSESSEMIGLGGIQRVG